MRDKNVPISGAFVIEKDLQFRKGLKYEQFLAPSDTPTLNFIILVQPTERLLTVYYPKPITVPAFYYQFTANIHWFSPKPDFARQPLLRPNHHFHLQALRHSSQLKFFRSLLRSPIMVSPLHQATFTIRVRWDGGTLCVPCPRLLNLSGQITVLLQRESVAPAVAAC
ncbi:hypothetical protein TNCV_4635121 [Trichonephila clavipes]|nr:hypothetical protein TNCV_4635121 [Trichonephila clavipes]